MSTNGLHVDFDQPSVTPSADDWRELFHTYEETINAPPITFAIEGFLQEQGITIIGGLAGHGKTLVMLAMAQTLLEGGKLFTKFRATGQAERVLYLIPECALSPFAARLKTFHLEKYVEKQLFYRTLSKDEIQLSLLDPRLLKAAEGAHVFLDTAIRFMEGDENGNAEQRVFAATLFKLIHAGARTVTGAHHSPKSFSKDSFMDLQNVLRGAGDIGAMLTCCWGLRQIDSEQNKIYVQNVKPRDFQACEPFIIQGRPSLDQTGYFEMTDPPGFAGQLSEHAEQKGGRPKLSKNCPDKVAEAWRMKIAGASLREIASKLGVGKSTVSDWFRDDEQFQ
jgi:hypothetical protein